ncbi:MAG: prepilin peptidase [Gammaproteobacteria bacterium]|nr:prepilin peptidase [Gammaproteobacteria bacterium]
MLALEYLAQNTTAFIITAGIFGLFLGSFLNVVIYRTPVMLDKEWRKAATEIFEEQGVIVESADEAETKPFNLVVPRSACPKCSHQITAFENVPLLSYLFLGGKCSGCKTPISIRYPLIELLTGILFAYSAFHFGWGMQAAGTMILVAFLVVLIFIDIDRKLLPDNIVYPLLWIGILFNLQSTYVPLDISIIGALAGYLSLWSIFWLFKLVTGKEGMGYGDFKLLAALGAWLGWKMLPLIIMLSSVVGAILGILILVLKKKGRDTSLPFGPYLAIAGLIALFWGNILINQYFMLMGI